MTPVPFFRALLSFTPRLWEPWLLRPPSSAVHLPCLSFPHDCFSPLSMEALWGHALLMWTIGCLQPAGELLKICLKQNYYVFEHSVVEEKKKSCQHFPSGSAENPCPCSTEPVLLQLSQRVTHSEAASSPTSRASEPCPRCELGQGNTARMAGGGDTEESLGHLTSPWLSCWGTQKALRKFIPLWITAWGCEALILQCWPCS